MQNEAIEYRVEIIQCTPELGWYRSHIGLEYTAYDIKNDKFYGVKLKETSVGCQRLINKQDVKIIYEKHGEHYIYH